MFLFLFCFFVFCCCFLFFYFLGIVVFMVFCLSFGFSFIDLFLVCLYPGLLMCLICGCLLLHYSFIFVVAANGREGCALSSFCVVVFLLFFPRGKGDFILHVSGVRDSSSAGQGLTYVSILEAYISFEGGCKGLSVSKNHYLLLYISQLHFYYLFVIFTCSSRLCLYMCLSLCVCLCTNVW